MNEDAAEERKEAGGGRRFMSLLLSTKSGSITSFCIIQTIFTRRKPLQKSISIHIPRTMFPRTDAMAPVRRSAMQKDKLGETRTRQRTDPWKHMGLTFR